MKIVSTTLLPLEGFALLRAQHECIFPQDEYLTRDELLAHLPTAQVIITSFDFPLKADLLEKAPNLLLIANAGAGVNNIDIDYCKTHNIVVTNTPKPVIEPTAELAFALMNAVARNIVQFDKNVREGNFKFGVMKNLSTSLYGKVLGIIGMGRIGQAVARRALANGMRIIYHNRHRLEQDIEKRFDATYKPLDELLQQSDFVSLNLPYTPESHHLINKTTLAQMKKTAFLLNTARGAHVCEQDLVEALKNGIIAGAALDVYEFEPQISAALKTLPNVILSPHTGTGTYEGRLEMAQNVETNVLAFLSGEKDKMDIVCG